MAGRLIPLVHSLLNDLLTIDKKSVIDLCLGKKSIPDIVWTTLSQIRTRFQATYPNYADNPDAGVLETIELKVYERRPATISFRPVGERPNPKGFYLKVQPVDDGRHQSNYFQYVLAFSNARGAKFTIPRVIASAPRHSVLWQTLDQYHKIRAPRREMVPMFQFT